MNEVLKAGLKYFFFFCLLYGSLVAISLIPQVGAFCNYLYRQPTESLLQGIFPKAYIQLNPVEGDADIIRVAYASKQKVAEERAQARANGKALQVKGRTSDIRFYNMFLSFYLFFIALMVLSPISLREMLTGLGIGTILFYLYTIFSIYLSLLLLFNEPEAAIYQTSNWGLNIAGKISYFLTLGTKVLFILILWAFLVFRKNNWQKLLDSKLFQ